MDLKQVIRTIPDFPQPGIIFRDITPILQDGECLRQTIRQIEALLPQEDFDLILGPESRGFIFGVPLAFHMGKGFVPVRKAGKLPAETVSKTYSLEYGTATIEMHRDAVAPGQKVVVVDDLLATGGTSKALAQLVEECGGIVVSMVFVIELEGLGGRKLLEKYDVQSVLKY